MVCNPYAIFRALLADPEFAGLTHVWVLDTEQEIRLRSKEYAGMANVRFVRFRSREYVAALATATYLIQNTSFPSFFAKRPGQVYVNTWHSAGAVKRMGFDTALRGATASRNVLRNLLMSDFIISPSGLMTKVFTESYRLKGLFQGKILEFGYPRNDVTLSTARDDVVAELQARGVKVDPAKKIILYAPTWRGTIGNIRSGAELLEEVRDALAAGIDTDEYQILIKPHQYHYSRLSREQKASGDYIPRQFNANRLLAAVDVLISDYSSIFFDFLVTDRPILFYLPDKEEYDAERGVYFSVDELPGPTTDRVADLADWVNRIETVSRQYAGRYERMKALACPHDDGHATERLVDAVFRRRAVPGTIDDCVDPGKKRVLIHVPDLSQDGIAFPLVELLAAVDQDRYDITVAGIGANPVGRARAEEISGARVQVQAGTPALTAWEAIGYEYVGRFGMTGLIARILRPQAALRREFSRAFGDARFDVIIDLSAHPGVFPWLAMQSPGSKRLVWQHTDMQADLENRRKWELLGTGAPPVTKAALLSVYAAFDGVVSTSDALAEINRAHLATPATRAKFRSVEDLVDSGRVQALTAEAADWTADSRRIVADVTIGDDGSRRTLELACHEPSPESGDPYRAFVTMGSLLPEKNLENLVLAFGEFIDEYPNSRLFIIGAGPLQGELERLVARPELRRRVCLTGYLRNPFAVLRHCDCFVFPSLYAGSTLSVAEARMLGLPIILGDFGTADAASQPDGQYVVGSDREAILAGLRAFAAGEVPGGHEFDAATHNARAVEQFQQLLETI
jgi:CDP-glycerol glycerophosphotransferase (TagB/SpsB family)